MQKLSLTEPVHRKQGLYETNNRHIWTAYVEEAEHLRHTEQNKKIYAKHKETIERVFADLKEKHAMRWTTLRGLRKVSMQAMLVYACMNLKKLATWLWNSGGSKHRIGIFCSSSLKNKTNS